jgi:hypothetical protein
MVTWQEELDAFEKSNTLLFKRCEPLLTLASRVEAEGNKDKAQKIRFEACAFGIMPIRPLSRRKIAKARFSFLIGEGLPKFAPDALDYYENRARSSQNSLIVARFADILWEQRKTFEFAQLAIDNYLQSIEVHRNAITDDSIARYLDLTDGTQRAAEIAISLNDRTRISRVESVCKTLLDWLESEGEYRWGLEILEALLEVKKYVTTDTLKKAYSFGEHAFEILQSKNEDNFMIQLGYVVLLCQLANALNDSTLADKWRKEIPATKAREAEWKDGKYDPLAVSILYQEVAKAYVDAGMKQESDEMLKIAQERMKHVKFHTLTTEVKIPDEKMENELKRFTEGKTPQEMIQSLSDELSLVPDYECAKQIAESTGGISSVIPYGLYDGTRRIGSATTPEEILQAKTAQQFAINCKLNTSLMLIPIIDKTIASGGSKNIFVDRLRTSTTLESDQLQFIEVGLERFLAGDNISSIHILIIQLEAWLRQILGKLGGQTTYVKDQIVHMHTLETILNNKLITDALGNRVWQYVNAILSDDLAFGLRDKVAHGLCAYSELDRNTAVMLVHICLLLTNVASTKQMPTDSAS